MACLKNGVRKDSVINWLRFLRVGLFSMRLHCTCIILGLHVDLITLDSCTYFKSKVILNSKFVLQSFTISYFKLDHVISFGLFSISPVPYMCLVSG